MKIGVTGATGFIGQNLIPEILRRGHHVVALSRDSRKAEAFDWFSQIEYISGDIREPQSDIIPRLAACDCVVHLAWPELPNYGELFHIETNYPKSYHFLKILIESGLKRLFVAGTCFEYGMKNGCLSENMPPEPTNAYGISKVFLHQSLQQLQNALPFQLHWLRLFYQYGPGQPKNSLFAQLDRAIAENARTFKMSRGEQLRDFQHIGETTRQIATLMEKEEIPTVLNVCSGTPISVRNLVELRIRELNAQIELELGYYNYSPFEPLAFWGDRTLLQKVMERK